MARLFEALSEILGIAVLLLGISVIAGWLFDVTFLKSILPGLPAMKVNLAAGFILLAASVWMIQIKRMHNPAFRLAARLCSSTAILIGVLTLVEYLAGWNIGIDQLLITESPGALFNTHPGRPSPLAALNLVLAGTAILAVDARAWRGIQPGHAALLVAGVTSLLTFIGHINGVPHFLHFIPESSAIAFHATIGFLALTAAILFARPANGLTAILISDTAGGVLARRVLLPSIVIMPVLDYAVTASMNAGFLDIASEEAIHTTWLMVFFTGIIVVTAKLLEKTDIRRTQAEAESARLATAVKYAGDAVVITGANGLIEYANPAFELITGYRADEVCGKNPRILKSGRHDRAFYEDLWRAVNAGLIWRGRLVNRKKDGSLYEEDMTISPITDASGAILNFVAVKRDVTREATLQKSHAYFTTIASHELRTPLTNLRLVETLLREIEIAGPMGARIEYVRGALLKTMASFDRVVNATTLIADMAWTGAEKCFTYDPIHRNLSKALEHARANLDGERRNIRIEADMWDIPHHATVRGNRAMIQQALDEVLSNAVKFTPDGKTIRVRRHISGGLVHIEVADEGDGIPADKLRDVLIPYYSLENPLHHSTGRYKVRGGGMGLGLTIVKLIMEHHSGTLTIGSRTDGAGTSVVLSFPLASDENPPVAA
ncbi:MAG: PAS domain S-box protein [Nitrospinae bacterium]|nr:PAS domain S-box protein [Nitrospinota bacterium]